MILFSAKSLNRGRGTGKYIPPVCANLVHESVYIDTSSLEEVKAHDGVGCCELFSIVAFAYSSC